MDFCEISVESFANTPLGRVYGRANVDSFEGTRQGVEVIEVGPARVRVEYRPGQSADITLL
jgi:hypothetical protein